MPISAVLLPPTLGVAVFCYLLMSTRFGLAMRSIHDDENVATLFGVNALMTRVAAFTVGAAIMGLGGALYGHYFNYIEAQQFNVLLSIYILLYVLLGGTQTAWGPLVGAIFFTAVPELIRQLRQARRGKMDRGRPFRGLRRPDRPDDGVSARRRGDADPARARVRPQTRRADGLNAPGSAHEAETGHA